MKNKKAFSLIELSIVLIIISLLFGAISGGASLIATANLNNARNMTVKSPVEHIDGLLLWLETSTKEDVFENAEVNNWKDRSQYLLNFAKDVNAPVYSEYNGLKGLIGIKFNGTSALKLNKNIDTTEYSSYVVAVSENQNVAFYDNNSMFIHNENNPNILNNISISECYSSGSDICGISSSGAEFTIGSSFSGIIYEIIIFDRVLFQSEQDAINSYLKKKYKL